MDGHVMSGWLAGGLDEQLDQWMRVCMEGQQDRWMDKVGLSPY